MRFPVNKLRQKFPAFKAHPGLIFMDAVGGTQVPKSVVKTVEKYYREINGNKGGIFKRSIESDKLMNETRKICAEFINADDPNEIVFGPNFTTLTFNLSRALAKNWRQNDEIIVSNLDHDANVAPWMLAAKDKKAKIHYFDIEKETCLLTVENIEKVLTKKTKLVAFCAASSAIGSKTDVAKIVRRIKKYNPKIITYIDAVAFAPHCPIDVKEWQADFVCLSTYKFFGPHMSFLWGKKELLEKIPAYKIRPAPDTLPLKWLNGSQTYELAGGIKAALEYIASIGSACENKSMSRREALRKGMEHIQQYEEELVWYLINKLKNDKRFKIWGITEEKRKSERVPLIAISLNGETSNSIAEYLTKNKIDVWSRSVYSLDFNKRLGITNLAGFIRVGLAHYNTKKEVDKLMYYLAKYADQRTSPKKE